MLMAASMPFISGMMTSLMIRSGRSLRARSTASRARINGGSVEPSFIQNDGQGVGNDSFVIDNQYLRLYRLCFHATLDWMQKLAPMLLRFNRYSESPVKLGF